MYQRNLCFAIVLVAVVHIDSNGIHIRPCDTNIHSVENRTNYGPRRHRESRADFWYWVVLYEIAEWFEWLDIEHSEKARNPTVHALKHNPFCERDERSVNNKVAVRKREAIGGKW